MEGYTEGTLGGDIGVAVVTKLGHEFFGCELVG